MPDVEVKLAHSTYPVRIARNGLRTLGSMVRESLPHDRAVLVIDSAVTATHGGEAHRSLEAAGFDVLALEMSARETSKTLETVRVLYDRSFAAGIERGTPLIAVGGGIVGDTAGFVAATYLRGIPLVQVPTTLLAMVDASIGGKTGVNVPLPLSDHDGTPALGKNLIGAFWQPRFVLADPETLETLDDRNYRCGLAECIKHGMIASTEHLTFLAAHHEAIGARDAEMVEKLIVDSVSIKARIVEADEREADVRALLNLGHTFAHAIESVQELGLRHGEAVAIGLCAATSVSELTQRLQPGEAKSLRELVALLGLPVRLPRNVDVETMMRAMAHDKKVRAGRLRLILPVAIGRAEIADDVDEGVVREAWRRVSPAG